MKSPRSLATIALTMLPLTSESQILIIVLKTKRPVRVIKYATSLVLYDGMTIFNNSFILSKNSLSTCPLPPFYTQNNLNKSFNYLLF